MRFLIYVVQLINQEPGGFAFWLNPFGPAEWDGCPRPPRVHSHHVTYCWAGVLAKAPPGNSVKHQHSLPKPQVAVWRYRGDQGASQPMCQAWWFLGNCETEDVRMVSWWKWGGGGRCSTWLLWSPHFGVRRANARHAWESTMGVLAWRRSSWPRGASSHLRLVASVFTGLLEG